MTERRITEQEYKKACVVKETAQKVISDYHIQRRKDFHERLKTNPIFKPSELLYSRLKRCPCGSGLAYPKDCPDPNHYWDCAAILTGKADPNTQHTDRLPFAFYSIKSEIGDSTTRNEEEKE